MQILVVVANIQLRIFRDISLKAEVGKGFVSTAIGHESLGTKANVGPHLWNGVMAAWAPRVSASCGCASLPGNFTAPPSWLKVKRA